jgi:rubrerythrin
MRNRIVKDGRATIFFLTQRKPHTARVLTGYYHVGWFTQGTYGAANNDYALAARNVRFFTPISTDDLPADLKALCGARFRTYMQIDTAQASALRELCDAQEDRTPQYVEEVARVERFARARSGFAYPSWGRESGFSWRDAPDYYPDDTNPTKFANSSRTMKWRCGECDYVITSGALLKKCPLCKSNSSLKPVEDA